MSAVHRVGNFDVFQGTYKIVSPCFAKKEIFTVMCYIYRGEDRIVELSHCLLPDIFPQLFGYF